MRSTPRQWPSIHRPISSLPTSAICSTTICLPSCRRIERRASPTRRRGTRGGQLRFVRGTRWRERMTFTVRSNSFKDGDYLANTHILSADFGFGCAGSNQSPHLGWSEAPAGTKSFAVTCLDPDAPTGSGFWHWLVVNIPANVMELPEGAGDPASGKMTGRGL